MDHIRISGTEPSSEDQFNIKKRLLLRYIHHFYSDVINDMDHMRISGNVSSSVILRQTNWFQKVK